MSRTYFLLLLLYTLNFLGQVKGSGKDVGLLTLHLVSNYMTKEEFFEECKKKLPIYRPNLTDTQVITLCLKALKSSLDTIHKSPVGKLIDSDSVPEKVVEHINEEKNTEGYKKLLKDVAEIFSTDIFFDEDLLEADNNLFSGSIQALMNRDREQLEEKERLEKKRRDELIQKRKEEIKKEEERLKEEEYRRKLEKKYPEAYHPLALEIFSTLCEEDVKVWISLPIKLQMPIMNYYLLLVVTNGKKFEKGDRHRFFVNAMVSIISNKNEIVIPKFKTLQDIRYEICKLGMLYKSGCKLKPFSILLSLPRHSFDIWKSFNFVLQFEFLVAMVFSINNNMNFDNCDTEKRVQEYLIHVFPGEDCIPMKHFKTTLNYLLKTAFRGNTPNLDNREHPFSVLGKDFDFSKDANKFSKTSEKTDTGEDLEQVKSLKRVSAEKKELTSTPDSDNIIGMLKIDLKEKIYNENTNQENLVNEGMDYPDITGSTKENQKFKDAMINYISGESNGLIKMDVEGLSGISQKHNPKFTHTYQMDSPKDDKNPDLRKEKVTPLSDSITGQDGGNNGPLEKSNIEERESESRDKHENLGSSDNKENIVESEQNIILENLDDKSNENNAFSYEEGKEVDDKNLDEDEANSLNSGKKDDEVGWNSLDEGSGNFDKEGTQDENNKEKEDTNKDGGYEDNYARGNESGNTNVNRNPGDEDEGSGGDEDEGGGGYGGGEEGEGDTTNDDGDENESGGGDKDSGDEDEGGGGYGSRDEDEGDSTNDGGDENEGGGGYGGGDVDESSGGYGGRDENEGGVGDEDEGDNTNDGGDEDKSGGDYGDRDEDEGDGGDENEGG
ncbi:large protein with possible signal peptide and acidic plus glycine repeats, partial [Cryptosporidium felis]